MVSSGPLITVWLGVRVPPGTPVRYRMMKIVEKIVEILDQKLFNIEQKALVNRDLCVRSYLGDRFTRDFQDYILQYEEEIVDIINFQQRLMHFVVCGKESLPSSTSRRYTQVEQTDHL